MILKVKNESQSWEIYELLHKLHKVLKADAKEGGDLGMDVQDKGIYSLDKNNGQYFLTCKRETLEDQL